MDNKKEVFLDRNLIQDVMKSLAQSQGFWGRKLAEIYSMSEEDQEEFWQELESEKFKTALDVVLYFEC